MNKQNLMNTGNFRDLSLKKRYTSLDNTLVDFFIPVIANSKYYYRASGYFSSSVLAAAARGLVYFINNGEKMYLITGVFLSKDDVEAIKEGLKTPPEVLEEKLLEELRNANLESLIIRKRLEVLAWLVSKGKLEIKLAIPHDISSAEDYSENKAIWHSKFAIFEDFNGNKLHIEGSINETAKGWIDNAESFSVHRSWIDEEKEYIASAEEEFWATWNNENPKVRTYTIPEAVKKELIKIAPSEIKDIVDPEEVLIKYPVSGSQITPWPHQEEAIQAWYRNHRRGILSMATGSGKTLTALFAVKRLPEDTFIVLLVPSKELVIQWIREIRRVFVNVPIIICSSQNPNWKIFLREFIWAYQKKRGKKFIIATIRSASSDTFIELINQELGGNYVLVVDEVHRLGARKSRRIMRELDPALGRLGLSATPVRIWDDVGTKMIMDYFGGIIYEYSLKDAIRDKRIVPYEYHVEIVPLTEEELYQYKEISRKIYSTYRRILAKYNLPENTSLREILDILEDKSEAMLLQNLLLKRAKIIKKAENKIQKTIEIIEKNRDKLGRCLIYCQDTEQLNILAKEMAKRGYKFLKYLGVQEKEKRVEHLRLFEEGVVKFLLSIRCLDEGIDIPASDSAIILASSTNPREFIQRRGRVLRKAPNKEKAIIYDLFVFPYDETYNYEIEPTEIEIFERELNRSLIFLESAIDSEDTLIKLLRLYRKLISLGGMNDAGGD
ncbi:DEAD/DEAH box helicase [Thermococcus sp. M39]|uniref:DEAD/DEAH box helicase family protein n=1 Tax=Thermococcus sp. M39 TaxID=1638262 RepID=UPI00143C51C4|nr:DEAD/DEAH box helicase family protein [Thermococcus sp. M39]NJE08471.1 DEAD/DEAH box helicase [Thermococcus sp. M39]